MLVDCVWRAKSYIATAAAAQKLAAPRRGDSRVANFAQFRDRAPMMHFLIRNEDSARSVRYQRIAAELIRLSLLTYSQSDHPL
jgi:hypothetical protein